jgi:ComEC/Rec2-related protein
MSQHRCVSESDTKVKGKQVQGTTREETTSQERSGYRFAHRAPLRGAARLQGSSDRGRVIAAHDAFPRAACPMLLPLVAIGLWIGSALIDSTGWTSWRLHRVLTEMVGPLWIASVCSCLAVGFYSIGARWITSISIGTSERTASAAVNRRYATSARTVQVLLVIASVSTGASLRTSETLSNSSVSIPQVPRDGMLVTVEGTLVQGWVERGFAIDLLAHHFGNDPRYQTLLRDVVFVADDGSRIPLDSVHGSTRHDFARSGSARNALLTVSVGERAPEVGVAERVRLIGVLRSVQAPDNIAAHDPRDAALRSGVVGYLSVEDPALCTIIDGVHTPTPFRDAIDRIRVTLHKRIRDGLIYAVPEAHGVQAMLLALVLGDEEPGYASTENAFRAAGLAHILAISGFNLAVLAWLVSTTVGMFVRSQVVRGLVIASAAAIALWLMAPAASATRAALMAIIGSVGLALGRDWHGDVVLASAAIMMLLIEPSVASDPGFQLSFGCVLALRHLERPIREHWLAWLPVAQDPLRDGFPAMAWDGFVRSIASGVAAFLVSTPLVLLHFGALQPWGIVLTILCAPLSSLTLVAAYPKAMVGALWVEASIVFAPIAWIGAWLQIALVEQCVSSLGGDWSVGTIGFSACVVMLGAAVLMLHAHRRFPRFIAGSIWAFMLFWILLRPSVPLYETHDSRFSMTMASVGNGSMYLIESGDAIAVFDAGSSSSGSVGTRLALPWIRERGGDVDAVFLSHSDLDHCSALLDLLRYTNVRIMYVHDSLLDPKCRLEPLDELFNGARQRGVEICALGAGDVVRVGCATWQVLWPPHEYRSKRDNDMSLVLRVIVDGESAQTNDRSAVFLLTGDIETEPCARLVAAADRSEIELTSDVMELPHHGSWREAVVALLQRATPAIILQSTGSRRLSHDRFAEHIESDSTRLVTCRDGAARIEVRHGSIVALCRDIDAPTGWRPVGMTSLRSKSVGTDTVSTGASAPKHVNRGDP